MVRAGLMPPKKKERLSAEEVGQLETWIKYTAFGIDPEESRSRPRHAAAAEPHRVSQHDPRPAWASTSTPTAEFPADDTGHGFDNIGDVLTISPLLMEKYIAAAKTIVGQAVPLQPIGFRPSDALPGSGSQLRRAKRRDARRAAGIAVLQGRDGEVRRQRSNNAGATNCVLDLTANETYVDGQYDYNKCRVTLKSGDKVLHTQEFVRQGGKAYRFEFDRTGTPARTRLSLELEPLTPKEKQVRNLTLRLKPSRSAGRWRRSTGSARRTTSGSSPARCPRTRRPARDYTRTAARAPSPRVPSAGRWMTPTVERSSLGGSDFRPAGQDVRSRRRPGDDVDPRLAAVPLPRGSGSSRMRANRIPCSTNTRSPRACRTSSGRRCRTTN